MSDTRHPSAGPNSNPDPITGAPGSHPVGTGLGAAAGGAVAGAIAGTVVGPVGTIIGAAAGAIVGGLAGHGVAEMIDPTVEETYWRDNYSSRPYVKEGRPFDDYRPAYNYGVKSYAENADMTFDQAEPELMLGWDDVRGDSDIPWETAREASRDSWTRASQRYPRAMP